MRLPHDLVELDPDNVSADKLLDTASSRFLDLTVHAFKRSSNSTACQQSGGSDDHACQTWGENETVQTLPIVLGVVIPLTIAAIVLVFLHRRYIRNLRLEEKNDPHKSLDFGLDGLPGKKGAIPEMTVTDIGEDGLPRPSRRYHGLSIDMSEHSPYLMPAALQGSRDSIHSLSRSARDDHDPYRSVALMRPSMDNDSLRSPRHPDDKMSLYSHDAAPQTPVENASLMANARPMSQSIPTFSYPTDEEEPHLPPLPSLHHDFLPDTQKDLPELTDHDTGLPPLPGALDSTASHNRLSMPIPPRGASMAAKDVPLDTRQSSNYGDEESLYMTPDVAVEEPHNPYDIDPSLIVTGRASLDGSLLPGSALPTPGFDDANRLSVIGANQPPNAQRLSVMGVRPLPPDHPDDNPEQRANRIRSFYREYFDDSKPNPTGMYEEDEPMPATIYDPETGAFYIPGGRPFAQGPGRRAMTPPPRGKPRVSGPHGRKFSMMSTGRLGAKSAAAASVKKLPPPKPLHGLPTPSLLKEDDAVFNAIDFAPPSSYRTLQNGELADNALGMERPYSPHVRAFTPLVSSFDHLTVMPSPHELRKSGTFTALDFAPPSRIREPGTSNDAGSIRSNRSGISAMHENALKLGAYRVSRIPKEMVTTREDLASQLRPTMDMISRA